ncbi:hypothetical protein D3C87_1147310 [compost metagenome]
MWVLWGFLQAAAAVAALFALTGMVVAVLRKISPPLRAYAARAVSGVTALLRPACKAIIARAWREMGVWSTRRVWWIAVFQIAALAIFIPVVRGELSLVGLIAALLIYPFFACALSLSLIAKLPTPRAWWNDASFKMILLGSQLISLFIAQGAANNWLGHMWKISATNVPLAHAAATSFMMLLFLLVPLLLVVFVFEILFCFSLAAPAGSGTNSTWQGSPGKRRFFMPGGHNKGPTPRKLGWGSVGIMMATFTTFLAGLVAVYAVAELPGTRLASTFLAAVAFELDAVPANRCELAVADREAALKKDPDVKVLFLSTTQERALVVRRADDLYKPIVLREFNAKDDGRKNITIGETVACHALTPNAGPKMD